MKRILSLVVIVAMVLTFGACSKKEEEKPPVMTIPIPEFILGESEVVEDSVPADGSDETTVEESTSTSPEDSMLINIELPELEAPVNIAPSMEPVGDDKYLTVVTDIHHGIEGFAFMDAYEKAHRANDVELVNTLLSHLGAGYVQIPVLPGYEYRTMSSMCYAENESKSEAMLITVIPIVDSMDEIMNFEYSSSEKVEHPQLVGEIYIVDGEENIGCAYAGCYKNEVFVFITAIHPEELVDMVSKIRIMDTVYFAPELYDESIDDNVCRLEDYAAKDIIEDVQEYNVLKLDGANNWDIEADSDELVLSSNNKVVCEIEFRDAPYVLDDINDLYLENAGLDMYSVETNHFFGVLLREDDEVVFLGVDRDTTKGIVAYGYEADISMQEMFDLVQTMDIVKSAHRPETMTLSPDYLRMLDDEILDELIWAFDRSVHNIFNGEDILFAQFTENNVSSYDMTPMNGVTFTFIPEEVDGVMCYVPENAVINKLIGGTQTLKEVGLGRDSSFFGSNLWGNIEINHADNYGKEITLFVDADNALKVTGVVKP